MARKTRDLYTYALERLRADIRPIPALADAVGLPRETLRDVMNGRVKYPRIDTARKIMSYYAVTL